MVAGMRVHASRSRRGGAVDGVTAPNSVIDEWIDHAVAGVVDAALSGAG